MKRLLFYIILITSGFLGFSCMQQEGPAPELLFEFEGNTNSSGQLSADSTKQRNLSWATGLDGQGLKVESQHSSDLSSFEINNQALNAGDDFTVQFWVKSTTEADHKSVFVSHKKFPSTSLKSQKHPGWVFYSAGGTWAWNMGSGDRRITYERTNGEHMPINDGQWHQLTMTYDSESAKLRLYYDGITRAIYNVNDDDGFDFSNEGDLSVGHSLQSTDFVANERMLISQGGDSLQAMVDEFDRISAKYSLPEVTAGEFESLVVEPRELFKRKTNQHGGPSVDDVDFSRIEALEGHLMDNPYTVHQVKDFMEVADLMQLYSLKKGKIVIDEQAAQEKAEDVKLHRSDYTMDNLAVWNQVLSPDEVQQTYSKYVDSKFAELKQRRSSLTVGVWNIHHGGIHATQKEDGWDSVNASSRSWKKKISTY